MSKLFFSYSHKDQALRDELENHLAQLKHEGIIETWHDRCINAGDQFDDEISHYLEAAHIILLLISPYFLASKYCYQIEMTRALERHDAKEARVIPVILHPCDWHTAPFAKLQAATKDGTPVSKYPNQHDAFLEVAKAIRAVAGDTKTKNLPSVPASTKLSKSVPRSSNLRVKTEFTEQEEDAFLEESFEFMANFFEASLKELQERYQHIQGRYRRITANHFTAQIYRQGKNISACGIRLGSPARSQQIIFSYDPESTSSYNDAIDVENDGHILFLKTSGLSIGRRRQPDQQLTQQGAAEHFWAYIMEPLQR